MLQTPPPHPTRSGGERRGYEIRPGLTEEVKGKRLLKREARPRSLLRLNGCNPQSAQRPGRSLTAKLARYIRLLVLKKQKKKKQASVATRKATHFKNGIIYLKPSSNSCAAMTMSTKPFSSPRGPRTQFETFVYTAIKILPRST